MDASMDVQIPFNVLLLEDEPEVLQDLNYEMQAALEDIYPTSQINSKSSASRKFVIRPRLIQTDNLDDAQKTVYSGKCDVLIADYRVKENANSKKDTATCLSLLRGIKDKKAFIPVIGHTAYLDLLEAAKKGDLAIDTVSKAHADSVRRVVEKGKTASIIINTFRKKLLEAYEELDFAATLTSPIDKQVSLEKSRGMFADLEIPPWSPKDYRRTIGTIVPMLHRVTSIPSESFGLSALSSELITILEPLIKELCKPLFSFEHYAMPVFQKLESSGYNIFMRLTDEAD